jgi:hypothetical protein
VSPGFLSENEQLQIDRTIDQALRAQVVINSLDPKGLAVLLRESDASRSSITLRDPHATQARDNLDEARALVTGDVLSAMAEGTGGEFFHDNNDLKAGFEALAGHSARYVLAFAPRDFKPDGRFHQLKVSLATKQSGYSIQARKGYFAQPHEADLATAFVPPKNSPEPAAKLEQPRAASSISTAAAKQSQAPTSEEQNQQQLQDALRSKTDSGGLPVGVDASPSEGDGATRLLAMTVHLDTRLLPLHKDGGHSLNSLTFAMAIFDDKDNVVQVKQRRANVDLTDDQLPDFLNDGVDVNTMFELKPGTYRLRVAVIESVEHRVGSLSRAIPIP